MGKNVNVIEFIDNELIVNEKSIGIINRLTIHGNNIRLALTPYGGDGSVEVIAEIKGKLTSQGIVISLLGKEITKNKRFFLQYKKLGKSFVINGTVGNRPIASINEFIDVIKIKSKEI